MTIFDLWFNRFTLSILFLLSLLCGGGCQGGLPMWSQANPCTEFTINPVNKTVTFYSNDGRAMTCDKIEFVTDDKGKRFLAEKLAITERSVENRVANAQQLEVIDQITGKMMEPWRILASRIPLGSGGGGTAPTTQPSSP